MAYTPQRPIITARAIADNLLGFITAAGTQDAALIWAGGSGYKHLKPLPSSIIDRTTPMFPSIAYLDDNDLQDLTEDLIGGGYSVTLECSIQDPDPDQAVIKAKVYAKMVMSLIANCPDATLIANTGVLPGAVLHTIETGFLPIKGNKNKKNDFLQQFHIKASYSLNALS